MQQNENKTKNQSKQTKKKKPTPKKNRFYFSFFFLIGSSTLAKMPLRHQPDTLQKNAMKSIAINFDYICYRAETKAEMAKMVSDDTYLQVEGPFKHLRKSPLFFPFSFFSIFFFFLI